MSNIRRSLKLTPGEVISISIGVNKVIVASNLDYGNHRKLILNLKRPISDMIGVPVKNIRFDNTLMPTGYDKLVKSDQQEEDDIGNIDEDLLKDDDE